MDGDGGFGQDCIDLDAYRAVKTNGMVHSKLRALYEYWEGLRAGRLAPMRSDVDPRDMAGDVRNIFILEDLGHGNIRFRIAGTGIVDAFGMELRGMSARSIMVPEARESFSALIAETLEDPGVGYARLQPARDPDAVWEINLLPLRSDFGAIDRVMGCLHPLSGTGGQYPPPLQFRIDNMSVESIAPTVLDADSPPPALGFAEPARRYDHARASHGDADKPALRSIEGGRGDGEPEGPRTAGHLRLVDD